MFKVRILCSACPECTKNSHQTKTEMLMHDPTSTHTFTAAPDKRDVQEPPKIKYLSRRTTPLKPDFSNWQPKNDGWTSIGVLWKDGVPVLPSGSRIEQSDHGETWNTFWEVIDENERVRASINHKPTYKGQYAMVPGFTKVFFYE